MIDYRELGARTLINASGTITTLGGSLMPDEVLEAMRAAAGAYVDLPDLLVKSGEYLARRIGVPAAFVCSGAASGMQLAAAGCLTGTDIERVRALPHTEGWADEFVIGSVDPHAYIHQGIEACGGTLVRVGTSAALSTEEMIGAIGSRTAAVVFFLGSQPGEQLAEVVSGAAERGVPVIVDAAAQLPPRSNLTELTGVGASLAVFSGGKGLRGPQCTGLVVGTPELVAAVRMNSSPESGIGRAMKVGKEEIMGLLAAVDRFLDSSDEEDVARWQAQTAHIAEALVTASAADAGAVSIKGRGQGAYPEVAPRLHVDLDPERASAVVAELWNGEPCIAMRQSGRGVVVDPMTLEPGDEQIVATRLCVALVDSVTGADSAEHQ